MGAMQGALGNPVTPISLSGITTAWDVDNEGMDEEEAAPEPCKPRKKGQEVHGWCWGGKFCKIPKDFTLPSCSLLSLWQQWNTPDVV
jgi:hypothetical protein